ncbi:MAG: class I SAM-dependent rRNA methyltransferase [Lentisphaeria bacterium]|nr:class I SAM-dependent rRNA methyltransferase [Lentisphaeria bacterium]
MYDIILKQGKERSFQRRHPWVFSGALSKIPQGVGNGETVRVLSSQGEFLGYGAYSATSSIAIRIWSFDINDLPGYDFFERKFRAALTFRKIIFNNVLPDSYRLVHAESDGLPGVIVDIYPGFAVCQLSTAGADYFRNEIADALYCVTGCNVYERSDVDSRKREGLPDVKGLLKGVEPPEFIEFTENGIRFRSSLKEGHKTGFYLDQRVNRQVVSSAAAGCGDVLNCFSYTGGFGLAALHGGAHHVLNVDSSGAALEFACSNAQLNGFSTEQFSVEDADVFQFLRKCRDSRKSFDMIILDPPKLAETIKQRDKAARAYKDLNLLGFKLLRPGGKLFTFSCSGAMDDDLFEKVVCSAAQDANVNFRIIQHLAQAPDHAVSGFFPEGHYLKGLYLIRTE